MALCHDEGIAVLVQRPQTKLNQRDGKDLRKGKVAAISAFLSYDSGTDAQDRTVEFLNLHHLLQILLIYVVPRLMGQLSATEGMLM